MIAAITPAAPLARPPEPGDYVPLFEIINGEQVELPPMWKLVYPKQRLI